MKKVYSLLILGTILATGVAQAASLSGPKDFFNPDSDFTTERNLQRIEHAKVLASSLTNIPTRASQLTIPVKNPTGEYKFFTKDVTGYLETESTPEYFDEKDQATTMVFGDNNTVYIQDLNPFGNGPGSFQQYITGYVESNNDITIPLPQTFSDDYMMTGYAADLVMMQFIDDDYEICDIDHATYVYNQSTGGYTLQLPGEGYFLGTIFSGTTAWLEDGIISETYTPFEGANSLPEGLSEQPFMFRENNNGYQLYISKDIDTLYIRGLSPYFPYGVVNAAINGNELTIAQKQIVGSAYGAWVETRTLTSATGVFAPSSTGYTMTADWTTNTITANNNTYTLRLCCGPARNPYFYEDFNYFQIYTQNSYEGTPANPIGVAVNTDIVDLGIYILSFELTTLSTENTVLLDNYLYYRVYIDGELYEFEANPADGSYQGIEGTITDIPYTFNNGSDIVAWSYNIRVINLYLSGVTSVGIQEVYKYDGKETVSDIVTYVIPEEDDGVESIDAAEVTTENFYDLSGRKVDNPANGIYVRKARLSNGKQVSSKVLKK